MPKAELNMPQITIKGDKNLPSSHVLSSEFNDKPAGQTHLCPDDSVTQK